MVDRGQAYTLEGVLAAILVVTATVYGLQAIDTRAWEDETQADTQALQSRASDVLSLAGNSGALRDAVTCYQQGRTINGDRAEPRSTFENMLNTSFDSQANQYNLYFSYYNGTDTEERLVSGNPEGSNTRAPSTAATASTTVTLTDSTNRTTGDRCGEIPVTVSDDPSFYIEENADSSLYNVVEVRLVVW